MQRGADAILFVAIMCTCNKELHNEVSVYAACRFDMYRYIYRRNVSEAREVKFFLTASPISWIISELAHHNTDKRNVI